MKRTALGFIGRKIYSSKIKYYENKYQENFREDWSNKPWDDYAVDCFKFETETKINIQASTGNQKMEYVLGLQALYNVREKELDYIEDIAMSLPISELKHFFKSDYFSILKDLKNKDLNAAIKLYSEFGNIVHSKEIKQNYKWRFVSACLVLSAVEEIFGNEIDRIQHNLRTL